MTSSLVLTVQLGNAATNDFETKTELISCGNGQKVRGIMAGRLGIYYLRTHTLSRELFRPFSHEIHQAPKPAALSQHRNPKVV
jgi:hypothetical protein